MYEKVKYNNAYNKAAYDRASINFPKGQKAVIEAHWRAKGYTSLNSYINDLIRQDMNPPAPGRTVRIGRDNNGTINM